MAGKNFQALVKDVSKPVTDESGMGGNPSVISVRHGPVTEGARNATDLQRTSALR
jgi:phosphohistidine swiveling domain-containing protein